MILHLQTVAAKSDAAVRKHLMAVTWSVAMAETRRKWCLIRQHTEWFMPNWPNWFNWPSHSNWSSWSNWPNWPSWSNQSIWPNNWSNVAQLVQLAQLVKLAQFVKPAQFVQLFLLAQVVTVNSKASNRPLWTNQRIEPYPNGRRKQFCGETRRIARAISTMAKQ